VSGVENYLSQTQGLNSKRKFEPAVDRRITLMNSHNPFKPVFLNHVTYIAQIRFGKNCVAHYLVSIGCAYIRINKHTLC